MLRPIVESQVQNDWAQNRHKHFETCECRRDGNQIISVAFFVRHKFFHCSFLHFPCLLRRALSSRLCKQNPVKTVLTRMFQLPTRSCRIVSFMFTHKFKLIAFMLLFFLVFFFKPQTFVLSTIIQWYTIQYWFWFYHQPHETNECISINGNASAKVNDAKENRWY